MRISSLVTLVEQSDPSKTHVIGDSHAVALGAKISGSVILAKNGAAVSAIAAQAQSVPDGAPVLMTAGANNVKQPSGVANDVLKIAQGLLARRCRVVYVGFPPIRLDDPRPSRNPNDGSLTGGMIAVQTQGGYQMVAQADIDAAAQANRPLAPVRGLPLAEVYKAAGYGEEYNELQQELMDGFKNSQKGTMVSAVTLENADINTQDPQGIHATGAGYGRKAAEAMRALDVMEIPDALNPEAEAPGVDQLGDEDREEMDANKDGKITNAEYDQWMTDNNYDSAGLDVVDPAEGIGAIFGMLLQLINRAEEIEEERKRELIAAIKGAPDRAEQRRIANDIAGEIPISAKGISTSAQLTTTSGNQAENALILAARRKWANFKDRELWIAALVAQCRAETDNFRLNTEVWGPTPTQITYDVTGPKPKKALGLGNDQPGDGFKYRGRGWLQITGKANYRAASNAAGIDLVANPEAAARADIANRTAMHYFETRIIGKAQPTDIERVSRLVNGGTNGFARRVAEFSKLLDNLRNNSGQVAQA
jgi:putative chitinase